MPERVVIITGATGGLGPSVVERFRRNDDTIVTVARKGAEISADLTNPSAAAGVVRQVVETHGRIDVLVHVMGGFAADGDVEATTDETWQKMISLNLMPAVYLFRAAIPLMKSAGHGSIVAVGSKAGADPGPGTSAYAASKAALHALVQSAAKELRSSGVTINAVLPGTIRTDANASWATPEQMATFVDPATVAEVIFFLASKSDTDITGVLVPVDGS